MTASSLEPPRSHLYSSKSPGEAERRENELLELTESWSWGCLPSGGSLATTASRETEGAWQVGGRRRLNLGSPALQSSAQPPAPDIHAQLNQAFLGAGQASGPMWLGGGLQGDSLGLGHEPWGCLTPAMS